MGGDGRAERRSTLKVSSVCRAGRLLQLPTVLGSRPEGMKQLPIIYVEDSYGDAELLSRALLQMRPQSKLAHFLEGTSAQKYLLSLLEASERPEAILVDVNLPGLNGKDLIRWTRQQPGLERLPVIALSGEKATEDELAAVGADLFIPKPPDYDGWIDLVYRIEDFLAERQG